MLKRRGSFKLGSGVRMNYGRRGFTSVNVGGINIKPGRRSGRRRSRGQRASSTTLLAGQARRAHNQKSLLAAFLWWLLLGLVGGHRYYLGRRLTAFLQTITIGGLGLWWLIDLLLLPSMVKAVNNERLLARLLDQPT